MGILKLKSNEDTYTKALRSLHRVLTKNFHSEIDLFAEYLKVGKQIFEMETGIISHIKDDVYTVMAFSSPLNGLAHDQTFDLQDTYCAQVMQKQAIVTFHHIGGDKNMCEHPVYQNMKLESYISAPIYVNDKIYGTINFSDRKVRHDGYDEKQIEIIGIMAKTIGRFLEANLYKEKLEKANDEINNLVGVVAHDLKNPLGNILSLSTLLSDEQDIKQIREYSSLIEQVSIDCIEMVNSILSISAIESGKLLINKSSTNILNTVEDAWATVRHLADKKQISHRITGKDMDAYIDSKRIQQTLVNLYSNAIKFSHQNSEIETTLEAADGQVKLKVADQGVGMSNDQVKNVFDPKQVTSTTGTNGESGTGYGLPLVAKIVEYHDGKIEIQSKKDQGTCFKLSIPNKAD